MTDADADGVDFKYVNLGCSNTNPARDEAIVPAAMALTCVSGSIVPTANRRYFTVYRATINGMRGLPVWVPPIDVGATGGTDLERSNITSLGVRLVRNARRGTGSPATFSQYGDACVQWVCPDPSQPIPSSPSPVTGVDFSSAYYFAYDVQWVVDLVNAAVATAATRMSGGGDAPSRVPILTYDGASALFTWYVPPVTTVTISGGTDVETWDDDGVTPSGSPAAGSFLSGWSIYVNSPLASLLANFSYVYDPNYTNAAWRPASPASNAEYPAYRMRCNQALFGQPSADGSPIARSFVNGFSGSGAPTWWLMPQQASSVDVWSPVGNLVFTSATLPAAAEIDLPELPVGRDTSTSAVTSFTTSGTVLDIAIAFTRPSDATGQVVYQPSGPPRLVSLTGDGAINDLQLVLKWRSKFDGLLRYVPLSALASVTIKVGFPSRALGGVA